MSIKKNLIANYLSQIYVGLIGIFVLPIYAKYVGAEAYGLIGFYILLQSLFQLLDMGLSPTISRQVSRYLGGSIDANRLILIIKKVEIIFFCIASAGAILILFSSNLIASKWLQIESLNLQEVKYCIAIMGFAIVMRWMCGFYRGIIIGNELFVWLSYYSVIMTTARFLLVIPIFWAFGSELTIFFNFQLFIAAIEIAVIMIKAKKVMPLSDPSKMHLLNRNIGDIIKFSLSIALTTSIWVLVTQVDKVMLSKILSLRDYGYFSMAVMAASGLSLISGPVSNVIIPRMTILYSQQDIKGLLATYRNTTQLLSVFLAPIILIFSFYAKEVLFVWTNDLDFSYQTAYVFSCYALGYAFSSFIVFPYCLQISIGKLFFHIAGSIIFLCLMPLSLMYFFDAGGFQAIGYAWLLLNGLYFFLWIPVIHNKYLAGMHLSWLWNDIISIFILPIIICKIVFYFIPTPTDRLVLVLFLAVLALFLIIFSLLSSNFYRAKIIDKFYNRGSL